MSQEIYNDKISRTVISVKEKLKKEIMSYKKLKKKVLIEEQNKFNTMVERLLSNERKLQSKFYLNFHNQNTYRTT